MGRKTTLWTFQATKKWHLTQEDFDMVKKGKPLEINWASSDSSTKQPHKDWLCQSKNWQDIAKK